MTCMSTPPHPPYEAVGRTAQKARTRDALVAAARELVARGVSPTVEQAAAAAAISRTTAYRYFPSQGALLAAAHPETAARSMLSDEPPQDPAERLDQVVRAFTAMIVDTEAQQRTMLRLSLQADPREPATLPLRQGRAISWYTEALEPLRDQLTDIAGLSRAQAVELMRWSAHSLLHAATTKGAPPEVTPPGA